MNKKIPQIDPNKCIGCGSCVAIASGTFIMNDSGKAKVKDNIGNSEKEIKEAIEICPVEAISME